MSDPTYVLAIDQGTTSSRAIVFVHDGTPVATGQLEHEQVFPRAGWVEHDPVEIWNNTREAIGQALSDPGNVGTLVRVADALGADAVWLTEGSADPENPKAVRASAGSLFHLPVVTGLAEAALPALAHEAGLRLVVATGDGDTDLEHADALLSQPAAWVFGNEAHGVPESLAAAADARVRIPLRGRAESLNIVTAASICLHTSSRLLAASGTGDAVRATPSA